MKALYHSSSFTTVKTVPGGELLAECFYLSTDLEAFGKLQVDLKSFAIREARWDIYRSPGGSLDGGRDLPGLQGVEAYFNSGGDLRREVGEEGGGLPRELLAECVRGIIQVETFLFTERGYPTARAYEEFWEKMYSGSCRYYSNLDRVTRSWFDHVGGFLRSGCLYNRCKNSAVYRRSEGGLTATGNFSDSFHELGVNLSLNGEGVAAACSGNFLRAPDRVCFENAGHLDYLTGKKISAMSKKAVAEGLGGPQGCNHLVDLVYDIGKAVASVLV